MYFKNKRKFKPINMSYINEIKSLCVYINENKVKVDISVELEKLKIILRNAICHYQVENKIKEKQKKDNAKSGAKADMLSQKPNY